MAMYNEVPKNASTPNTIPTSICFPGGRYKAVLSAARSDIATNAIPNALARAFLGDICRYILDDFFIETAGFISQGFRDVVHYLMGGIAWVNHKPVLGSPWGYLHHSWYFSNCF